MSDKTILDSNLEQEVAKTVLDLEIDESTLSLTTFRGNTVIEELEAIGAEADVFILDTGNHKSFLKLYRRGIKINDSILNTIKILSREHKFFAEVYEYGFDDKTGRYYELLEYIENGNLDDIGDINVDEFIPLLNKALHTLHANNIIHRDLKPTNILIRNLNPLEIVLIDFGVSSSIEGDLTKILTTLKGTYAYTAPEMMSGYIGKEVDYFAFGMIILDLVAKNPLVGLDGVVILNTLATKNIDIPKNIDYRIELLLKGLLTRDPQQRWGYSQIEAWMKGKSPAICIDEEKNNVSNTLKYKFKNQEYTQKELVQAFAKRENFEDALKHIGRGYITKYLEKLDENDEAIKLDEEYKTPIEKLVYFIYSQETELPFSIYGVVIDEEYMFNLLIKFAQHNLTEIDQKIFDLFQDDKLSRLIQIYEVNHDLGLKDYVDYLPKDEYGIYAYLDVDKAIQSQDIRRINHIIRSKEKLSSRQIDQLIEFKNEEIVQHIIAHTTLDANHIKSIFSIGYGEYLTKDLVNRIENKTEVILNLIDKNQLEMIQKFFPKHDIVSAASSILNKPYIDDSKKRNNYQKIRIVKKASTKVTTARIKSFIKLGLDGNTKNSDNESLFDLAVGVENDEVIKILSESVNFLDVSEHLKEVIIQYDLIKLFKNFETHYQDKDYFLYIAIKNKAKKISFFLIGRMDTFQDKLLFLAIATDQLDMIKLLHNKGISLESRGKYGDKPIIYAFEKDRKEIAQFFIDQNIDLDTVDKKGNTVLILSILNKWDMQAKELIDLPITDVNKQNDEGSTALHYTLKQKNIVLVSMLLKMGADDKIKNNKGATPLYYYVNTTDRIDIKIIELFLADKSKTLNDLGVSLRLIAEKGLSNLVAEHDFELFDLLIDNGLDLNERDIAGYTLFHELIDKTRNIKGILNHRRYISILLKYFLQKNANPYIQNNLGFAPIDLEKEILEKEYSILEMIITRNHKVLKLFLSSNQENKNNTGILLALVKIDDVEMLRLWLEYDALSKDDIVKIYFLSIEKKKNNIFKYIVDNLIDINKACNNNNDTGLHTSIFYKNIDATKILLNKDTDVNKQNKDGQTALHLCVKNNNREALNLLFGAQDKIINKKDKNGKTPVEIAIFNIIEAQKKIKEIKRI